MLSHNSANFLNIIGRAFLLFILAAMLVACGGGGSGSPSGAPGGGSGGSGGGTGGGSTGGSGPTGVDFDSAFLTAKTSAKLIEYSIELSLATINPIIDLINTQSATNSSACNNGGSIEVIADNLDLALGHQVGDRLEVRYFDCLSPVFDVNVQGRVVAEIESIFLGEHGEIQLTASIFPQDVVAFKEEGQTTIGGSARVAVVARGSAIELLSIDFSPDTTWYFALIRNGVQSTERISSGSIRRFMKYVNNGSDQPYSIEVDMAVVSELLGFDMDCSTERPLTGPSENDDPDSGLLACIASDGSRLELISDRANETDPVTIRVDPEGDGSYLTVDEGPQSSPIRWGDLFSGRAYEKRLAWYSPTPTNPPLAPTLSATFNFNDLALAPSGQMLYASTADSLLEISLENLVAERTLQLAGTPGALGIARDGSEIYVALDDLSEISRIDVETLTVIDNFPLGDSSYVGVGPRKAYRIGVANNTSDPLIVISTPNFVEMVAYLDGTPLPNIITDQDTTFSPPRSFILGPSDTISALDSTSTAYTGFNIDLDQTTGLSVVGEHFGIGGNHLGKLKHGASHVFASGGRVFNTEKGTVEANLRPMPFGFYDDVAATTPMSGRVYALRDDNVAPILDIYSENLLFKSRDYLLQPVAGSDRFRNVMLGGDYLAFSRGNLIERLRVDSLTEQRFAPECGRFDLSGLLVAGSYKALTCEFTTAVYDAERDLIYAGRGATGGLVPSVVVIDINTWSIVQEIPYSAPPIDLSMSDDGVTLFVVLEGLNQVGTIDLELGGRRDDIVLGTATLVARVGESIDTTTSQFADFVVSKKNAVGAYAAGVVVGDVVATNYAHDQLFASDDGIHIYGRSFDDITVFDVSENGVSLLQRLIDVVFPRAARQRDENLYFPDGSVFSFQSMSVSSYCDISELTPANSESTVVGPDNLSEKIYLAAVASPSIPGNDEFEIVSCDPETGIASDVSRVLSLLTIASQPKTLLPVSGGKVVLATDRQIVLLDRPD